MHCGKVTSAYDALILERDPGHLVTALMPTLASNRTLTQSYAPCLTKVKLKA